MKTRLLLMLFLAAALIEPAFSVPTTISDTYVDSDSHGYGDVMSSANDFQINSMDVSLSGSILSVSINTNFACKADDGLFTSLTGGDGIGYGDLFLSSSWNPFGSAPYEGDDSNGTLWT